MKVRMRAVGKTSGLVYLDFITENHTVREILEGVEKCAKARGSMSFDVPNQPTCYIDGRMWPYLNIEVTDQV